MNSNMNVKYVILFGVEVLRVVAMNNTVICLGDGCNVFL